MFTANSVPPAVDFQRVPQINETWGLLLGVTGHRKRDDDDDFIIINIIIILIQR